MSLRGNDSKDNSKQDTTSSSSPTSLSAQQVRDEVRNAISHLEAKGIASWQILDVWSQAVYEQGKYAIADTLANAAYELGKPVQD
ncbi:MAG: hypothetical protein JOZ78_01715 [Chroococcidiopsidaceae cyanobacterium CP_BM_ER_R8_30]|nr:hypothetical protein [Chroococcidiopsidaceae cyanobacterium CP_BM_ER_R8_30]